MVMMKNSQLYFQQIQTQKLQLENYKLKQKLIKLHKLAEKRTDAASRCASAHQVARRNAESRLKEEKAHHTRETTQAEGKISNLE